MEQDSVTSAIDADAQSAKPSTQPGPGRLGSTVAIIDSAKPLSPATAAVLNAAFPVYDNDEVLYFVSGEQHTASIAAAALRAAADQVVPEEPLYGGDQRWMYERDTRQASRKKLLAIAVELEGAQ